MEEGKDGRGKAPAGRKVYSRSGITTGVSPRGATGGRAEGWKIV